LFSWDMFKGWLLISNYTLHKYLICWLNQLHVNYKHMSFNLLSLCIISRYWKLSDYFLQELHIVNPYIEEYMFNTYEHCNIWTISYIYCQYSYIDNIFNSTLKMKYPSKSTSLYYFYFYQCCVYEIRTRFNKFILNIKFINI